MPPNPYFTFHSVPPGVSSMTIPLSWSSLRIRSASSQFFSFRARSRSAIHCSRRIEIIAHLLAEIIEQTRLRFDILLSATRLFHAIDGLINSVHAARCLLQGLKREIHGTAVVAPQKIMSQGRRIRAL